MPISSQHIVPELQRRGLFHKDYAGKTLRENLGLRRPGRRRMENPAAGRGRIRKRGTTMRWLKFTAAGKTSWGIVEGDNVITVSGDPFGEWQRTAQPLR